jgi:hypothetical protein
VYENKQNSGKMPGERLDIYIKVTRFLQKIAGFDRQLARSCAFTACGMRKFPPKVGNAIGRKRPYRRLASLPDHLIPNCPTTREFDGGQPATREQSSYYRTIDFDSPIA